MTFRAKCHSNIFCKLQGPGFVLATSHTDMTLSSWLICLQSLWSCLVLSSLYHELD